MLRAILKAFTKETAAQGLAEYCLIAAMVALMGLGILIHVSGGVQAIWSSANSTLASGGGSSGLTTGSTSSQGSSN